MKIVKDITRPAFTLFELIVACAIMAGIALVAAKCIAMILGAIF